MVGRHAQFGARRHGAGQEIELRRREKTPPMMSLFRPRIRKQDEYPLQRCRRHPFDESARVIRENPDVVERPAGGRRGDLRQQPGNAVYVRLAADKSDIRVGRRLRRQMFAASETDLKPDRANRPVETVPQIEGQGLRIERKPRQQAIHKRLTARPQAPAAPPAMQYLFPLVHHGRTSRDRPAPVPQVNAAVSESARSVRSHEKPPSASGPRPKWPYAAVRA